MELGQTTIWDRQKPKIDKNVVWFASCLFVIVAVTLISVVTLSMGRNSLAMENAFNGKTEDEKFANFRKVKVGRLKNGVIFRSASPVDNAYDRAAVVDRLASKAGIQYAVNLSDNESDLTSYFSKDDFDSANYRSLYDEGKVVLLHMNMKYEERVFGEKLARGLTSMIYNDGPYLVHCVEGKDRTGFVMMVLEALAGASYEEIVDDYMISFDNYYGVNSDDEPEQYKIIKKDGIDTMLHYVINDKEKKTDLASVKDYSGYAKDYLKSIGMNEKELEKLVARLEE